jgi:hypothetical protein
MKINWDKIQRKNIGFFEYSLLSKKSDVLLNIGYTPDNKRCLLLELHGDQDFTLPIQKKANLSIVYFKDINCICIVLQEDFFALEFDDFILSIQNVLEKSGNKSESAKILIKAYNKWSSFFNTVKKYSLSENEIKGLFAELFCFLELISNEEYEIDTITNSWVGPLNKSNDFVLPDKFIEVKAIDYGKKTVSISSIHQLKTPLNSISLFLNIYELKRESVSGITIQSLVQQIKDLVFYKNGTVDSIYEMLNQHSLNIQNISELNDFKFSVINLKIYDASNPDFPRISYDNVSNVISSCKYELLINELKPFLVQNIDY